MILRIIHGLCYGLYIRDKKCPYSLVLCLGPKMALTDPKMTQNDLNPNCKVEHSFGHFEWSHDQFTTTLSLGSKLAKSGQKWPKKVPNDRKWPEFLKKFHLGRDSLAMYAWSRF